MNVRAGPFGCAAIPQRRIGILDASVIENFFFTPLSAGRLDLIPQRDSAAMGESWGDIPLGRTVVIHINMRTVRCTAEIALRLGIVQRRFSFRGTPRVAAIGADAGIGARRIGGESGIVVVRCTRYDLKFSGCVAGGDVTLVKDRSSSLYALRS